MTAFISTDSFGADSIRINGQGTQNVNYTLDGAGNNDTFNGGNGGAQARTPVEAVQEFQLLTSQFDAEFGASSGGVVNAVSKQGTNASAASAFYFKPNQDMTAQNYFAEKQNLEKAEAKQKQFGGNIGGPIIRDKLHFFGNLERIDQNRGVTMNIPARPELNFSDFTHDNVWNWMARMDHQINGGNTWAVRYLRETSPQSNQFPGVTNWTKSRAEKETDTDWTIVGTLNSVIKNTRVNTLKLSYTQGRRVLRQPRLLRHRRPGGARRRSLAFQTHHGRLQHARQPPHGSRVSVRRDVRVVRARQEGDHDLKFGVNIVHTPLHIYDASTLNGTFGFSATDLDFDRNNPRTYPDRLTVRVPAPSDFIITGTYFGVFAQDKWKINNRLTASLGVRWDTEILPIEEKDNPKFASPDEYPRDMNNFAPRLGFDVGARRRRARRCMRGGWGMFYQKTPFTFLTGVVSSGVYLRFVHGAASRRNNIDAGPSQGRLPTDPFLVNGPVVNRALLNSMFPAGTLQKNTGTVQFDNPDRTVPYTRQASVGYERQLGGTMAVSADYIRNDLRELYLRQDLNPGVRATTARTAPVTRVNAANFTASVLEITNLGWANSDSLQFSLTKRAEREPRLSRCRTRCLERVRQRGSARHHRYGIDAGAGRPESGGGRSADDAGPSACAVGFRRRWTCRRPAACNVSGALQYQSGTPFTLTDSTTDPNRNGSSKSRCRPAPTAARPSNSDAITVENKGGFRGARGPDQCPAEPARPATAFRLPRRPLAAGVGGRVQRHQPRQLQQRRTATGATRRRS